MYRNRRKLAEKCDVVETADASFKKKSRPFSFLANKSSINAGWTPTMLTEQYEVYSFGKLQSVILLVTTENFENVLMLIEAWHEAGVAVELRLPSVDTRLDGRFADLAPDECYYTGNDGKFLPTNAFITTVRETFVGDDLVTLGV
jgi:hypothetical protein